MTSRAARRSVEAVQTPTTTLELRPLDVHDDGQLRRWHEIGWRAEKDDGRPWNDFWSLAEMQRLLREPTDDSRLDPWCVVDGDQVVGAGLVETSELDNLDKCFVFPAVEPELRGRGIGGFLLDALVERAGRLGRTQVVSAALVPYGERDTAPALGFAARHGFAVANVEVVRSLRLPLPAGLLDGITAETASHHRDYVVESYVDEVPERHLASYCHLLNQLALDAPTGDVDFEASAVTPEIEREKLARARRMGRSSFITLALRDGEAVAHSDLFVLPDDTVAHQMGTLVRRDHRGHRLGTAVKVANLARLTAARPDVREVHTQNAETNGPMVDINVRLGFEPVGVCPMFLRDLGAGAS